MTETCFKHVPGVIYVFAPKLIKIHFQQSISKNFFIAFLVVRNNRLNTFQIKIIKLFNCEHNLNNCETNTDSILLYQNAKWTQPQSNLYFIQETKNNNKERLVMLMIHDLDRHLFKKPITKLFWRYDSRFHITSWSQIISVL